MSVCGSIHQNDTIREGGDSALGTVNTVDTVYMAYTVDMVYTVHMVYIVHIRAGKSKSLIQ